MRETVDDLDLGVIWDPNAPEAILVADDFGKAVLALRPRWDDPDQRCVILAWNGTCIAHLGGPNDEAISGHRLWSKGLAGVLWAGQVRQSHAIRDLERRNRVHPSHDPARFEHLVHFVVRLKDGVAEVIAESVTVRRGDGDTLTAAAATMRD